MKNPAILGALFVAAFVAALVYFKPEPASLPAPAVVAATREKSEVAPVMPTKVKPRSRTSNGMPSAARHAGVTQTAQDPRLAALEVSPENGLIEYVRGPDERVIAEIDKDPNSPGFGKPTREYTYSDARVIGLTSYRYLPDLVEITRTAVSYKPDGSVDGYTESTSSVRAKDKPKDGH